MTDITDIRATPTDRWMETVGRRNPCARTRMLPERTSDDPELPNQEIGLCANGCGSLALERLVSPRHDLPGRRNERLAGADGRAIGRGQFTVGRSVWSADWSSGPAHVAHCGAATSNDCAGDERLRSGDALSRRRLHTFAWRPDRGARLHASGLCGDRPDRDGWRGATALDRQRS